MGLQAERERGGERFLVEAVRNVARELEKALLLLRRFLSSPTPKPYST